MKYEIIKGSEKDFEGAPEDTLTVYRLKGSRHTHLSPYRADEFAVGVEIIAERRPITEPVVWLNLDECDGSEYLGPVIGREMECHAKDGSIFAVVVVAFDGDLPIVKTTLHGNYFGCDPIQLRPIRSAEDVARDEAVDAIKNKLLVRREVAESFYDFIANGNIPTLCIKDN